MEWHDGHSFLPASQMSFPGLHLSHGIAQFEKSYKVALA
jgi:hypothetical protein